MLEYFSIIQIGALKSTLFIYALETGTEIS